MAALLLLRLSRLRGQRQGRGSLAEQGYALVAALIASFVLLLGMGAVASRTQLGFVGQAFQSQNRQARDVAEAAIAEFVNTMNQERNRHLLIAGTTANWNSARWSAAETDFRNICTAFEDDMTLREGNAPPVITDPDAAAITRFTVGATRNLFPTDADQGQFIVEGIEFLNQNRTAYVDADGGFLPFTDPASGDPISYGTLFRTGSQRSLIRLTVVGSIQQANGRVSTARVAREFEVVPKCCKRSFGRNVFGGQNWGRDAGACGVPADKLDGLVAGMNGGLASGNGNLSIIQEDGTEVAGATCWAGNEDPSEPSDLSNDPDAPNAICTNNNSIVNNISFTPRRFNFVAPEYSHPSGADPAAPVVNVDSSYNYLYFDPARFVANAGGIPDSANPNRFSGIVLSSGSSNFRRIDDAALSANSPDPCYIVSPIDQANGRPYYEINCRVLSINPSGNRTLYIDTTLAKINIFFVGTGNVGIGSGTSGTYRIHGNNNGQFRASLSSPTPTTAPPLAESNCVGQTTLAGGVQPCLIRWPSGTTPGEPLTPAQRLNTFLERCTDRGGYSCINSDGDEDFSVRRLLNFYASGNQSFTINGASTGVGYNIYAPFGDVTINGGSPRDNLMGQIWTNNLTLRGRASIQTFNSSGGSGTQAFAFGRPLIDFAARSFTQSSGFGLGL